MTRARELADQHKTIDVDGGTIKLDGNYPVGTNNVALGNNALDDGSLSGNFNTAIGANALTENTSGAENTAIGEVSLRQNSTGSWNTAVGRYALRSNTNANYNTAIGLSALHNNTTADYNTAVGYQAGYNNTGEENTAVGYRASWGGTTAIQNVSVGYFALGGLTTGSYNTAVGYKAGNDITTGERNVYVGRVAGDATTTGSHNTGIGYGALLSNLTSSYNTVVGNQAGYFVTSSYNTLIGRDAGFWITTGTSNTVLGRFNGNQDGLDIRTTHNNIVLSDGSGNVAFYRKGSNGYISLGSGATNPIRSVTLQATEVSQTSSSSSMFYNISDDAGDNGSSKTLIIRGLASGGSSQATLSQITLVASTVSCAGALVKASGSFRIPHPLEAKKDTHDLVHSFVEAPQADNIYRGKVALVAGSATVNIDTVAGMTDGTFAALNREVQCFTSNETGWTAVKGSVSGNVLTITAQDNTCTDTISWLVIGERQDQHMYDTEWTDDNGKVIVEPLKSVEES